MENTGKCLGEKNLTNVRKKKSKLWGEIIGEGISRDVMWIKILLSHPLVTADMSKSNVKDIYNKDRSTRERFLIFF